MTSIRDPNNVFRRLPIQYVNGVTFSMSNPNRYTCPMCNGEGKLSAEIFDPNASSRHVASIMMVVVLFLGSGFLYWMTLPNEPKLREVSVLEQCSTACGPGRFKSWTDPVEGFKQEPNHQWVPKVPAKCECWEKVQP